MTTTVCDLTKKLITADTRWSHGVEGNFYLSDGKSYFVYCDDTGFDKITKVGTTALITAGNGQLISDWKKWWKTSLDLNNMPSTEVDGVNAIQLAIVNLKDNSLLFEAGSKLPMYCEKTDKLLAFCTGSGGSFAIGELKKTGCAKRAVELAALHDYCTSNSISFLCYQTYSDNLNHDVDDYMVIANGLLQRGFIMERQASNASSIGIEISKHPLHQEISEQFMTGKAVASAPAPGVSSFVWTESEKERFKAAIDKVKELRAE